MALMTFDQAKEHLSDPHACFKLVTSTRHLALLPKYLGNIKAGIIEHLDSQINLTSKSFDGVPIAYCNVKCLQKHGHILDETPNVHLEVQAQFIVFQPDVHSILRGVINKISNDHIGCLVHGRFNASVPKSRKEGESWPCSQLEIGDEFLFRVVRTSSHNGVLSIKGVFHESVGNHNKTPKKRTFTEMSGTPREFSNEMELDLPNMVRSKKHKRKHSSGIPGPDFIPLTSTPYQTGPDRAQNPSDQDISIFDTTDAGNSELSSSHKKKKKKKKHKLNNESMSLDLSSLSTPNFDNTFSNRSCSPDAPSDMTHDSGIMSVGSDTCIVDRNHKKPKKKKSKMKE